MPVDQWRKFCSYSDILSLEITVVSTTSGRIFIAFWMTGCYTFRNISVSVNIHHSWYKLLQFGFSGTRQWHEMHLLGSAHDIYMSRRGGKERGLGQGGNVTSDSLPPRLQPLHESFRIKMAPLACSEVSLGKSFLLENFHTYHLIKQYVQTLLDKEQACRGWNLV